MKKIIAKLLLLLSLVLILATTTQAVWINQVYYDPIGSETNGEAIELYNPSNQSADISGWVIWTTSSKNDAVLPEGSFIEPYGYFLIADSGWSESKDNKSWRNADFEEKITLKNSNGGIALKDSEGNIVDAVGWGDEEEIPDELFEEQPSKKTKAGESLLRLKDSDDNSQDFVAGQPYFFTTGEFIVAANISEENEISDLQILDDDSPADGIQITPLKGGNRKVRVKTYSSAPVMFNGRIYNLTRTNNSYEAVIDIPYSTSPGTYTIKAGNEMTEIEILPVRGLSINIRKLDVNIIPGSYETKKISIINTGNVELKLFAKCKKLVSGSKELAGSVNVLGKTLGEKWQELRTLSSGETLEAEISISASDDAEKGDYKSIISFKGE
ncbi:hypothetical protein DRJ25_00390 [Candidatus Woesearchaeota archaeon]|nr:MAG: hypothetical protein DRJ25_00390 [Candidatus Woesearchaeota archaeon]